MTQAVLHFVGDGELDRVVVPHLVERIIGRRHEVRFVAWKEIRGNKPSHGYGRKLRYAILDAKEQGEQGVVATLDRDRAEPRAKLHELQSARNGLREQGHHIPVALGEANPHLEAWLIDEPTAVRAALQLEKSATVPNWRKSKYPKDELGLLLSQSTRSHERPSEVWPDIARAVVTDQMLHPQETGWQDFEADIRAEFG